MSVKCFVLKFYFYDLVGNFKCFNKLHDRDFRSLPLKYVLIISNFNKFLVISH